MLLCREAPNEPGTPATLDKFEEQKGQLKIKSKLDDRYSLTLFDHFRPVKRPGEYFAKEWSE